MTLKKTAEELSQIEKDSLLLLEKEFKDFNELKNKTKMNSDALIRGLAWLTQKELAETIEQKNSAPGLTGKGKEAVKEGLPERKFLQALKELNGSASLKEIQEKGHLKEELNIAFGTAKKNGFISVQKKGNDLIIEFTGLEKEFLEKKTKEEEFLEKASGGILSFKQLNEEELQMLGILNKRGLIEQKEFTERKTKITEKGLEAIQLLEEVEEQIIALNQKILLSGEWRKKPFKKFNLLDPVPSIFIGKRQPYIQFLNLIRKKLVELGFKEMLAPTIVTEFYNFDALFQPQNHPARTWTDTYQLKKPSHGALPEKEKVKAIKEAHEFGGVSASNGWGYSWSEIIASKLMPSAHATAHSARQLAQGIEVPGKYFAIARVYRPDVIDATHLVEFNQMDGFIADKELSFRHLLGILKQFALEIAGASKVRFYPDYYPFTEPSVQLSAKHPELGWIEFAGAGMFRPEITENLGIKEPIIAWGMGIDRLAMFKLGIKDIRHLFSESLEYLRNAKIIGVEQ